MRTGKSMQRGGKKKKKRDIKTTAEQDRELGQDYRKHQKARKGSQDVFCDMLSPTQEPS